MDREIEMELGSKSTYREFNQLLPAELLAAKKYMEANLAAGNIQQIKSPYGTPMFFAREIEN